MSFPTLQSLFEAKKLAAKDLNDAQVEFVDGWAQAELHDYTSLKDAEAEFWDRVNCDEDRKSECKKLKLTKALVRDILSNIADNMGIELD